MKYIGKQLGPIVKCGQYDPTDIKDIAMSKQTLTIQCLYCHKKCPILGRCTVPNCYSGLHREILCQECFNEHMEAYHYNLSYFKVIEK